MLTSTAEQAIQTLEIRKEETIAAPVEIVFETLLEHLGPHNETGPDSPLPMKLVKRMAYGGFKVLVDF